MPHLDCVAVPAVHPKGPTEFVEMGFEATKTAQKQQIKEEHSSKPNNLGGNEKMPKRKATKGMPVTEESLTQFQLDKLAELRTNLGSQVLQDTPIFDDNFSLLRWLHGWNYRIEEIVPRFKKASSVFRCMRVNERVIEDVDELNEFARTLTDAADYFPGGVLGYDREGNVVVMQRMGQSHPKQLSKCGRVSDVYRLSIVETALLYQLIRLQERKRRRKLGLRVIIDLEGFNSDHVTTFGLKVYGALLKSMQDMFPDLLRQVYVINAHYLVKTAYTIIKPVLSEQSREKVVFLDSAFHEQLAKDIGPENLFPKWGGTRQPSRGHPEFGTLRVGGVPPTNLRYSPATHPHMPEGQLKKFSVPARQRREIEVPLSQHQNGGPSLMLHWFWTSSSDIDFGLMIEEEKVEEANEGNVGNGGNGGGDKEIWPMFRLLTDFVPEYGCARVEAGRKYKFVFDNSFSVFTWKEIKFGFKLVEISEEIKIAKKIGEEEKENALKMNGQIEGNLEAKNTVN